MREGLNNTWRDNFSHAYFWGPKQWENTWGAKKLKVSYFLTGLMVQTNRYRMSKYYYPAKYDFLTFWCYLNSLVHRKPYFVKLGILKTYFGAKEHVLVLDLWDGIIIWHPPRSYHDWPRCWPERVSDDH